MNLKTRLIVCLLFPLLLFAENKREPLDLQNFEHREKDLAGKPAVIKNGVFSGDHLDIRVMLTAEGDLDGDGDLDGVVVCVIDGGGSGNFRELCLLINHQGKLTHTERAQLGDRIRVNALSITKGVVEVNYLDRKPDEAMAVAPTVAKRVRYVVKGGTLKAR